MAGLAATSGEVTGSSGHSRFSGAVRSEWTKLRTVRSTLWSVVATVGLSLAIGIVATAVTASRWNTTSVLDRITFDPTSRSLTGLLFGQLAIGVLGVLVMSAEYGTGTIRATLTAVPNRRRVLGAKVVVFAAVALVIGELSAFSSFLVGQQILAGSTPYATLGQPGVLRAVIGGGLYLVVLGLLALGIAVMVRHTAGAISAFVGVLFVLPLIDQALPTSVADAVGRFLPAEIGAVMTTTRPDVHLAVGSFAPWVGFGLLCAYAVVALLVGGVLLERRDA